MTGSGERPNRLEAWVDPENVASPRVLMNAGSSKKAVYANLVSTPAGDSTRWFSLVPDALVAVGDGKGQACE